MTTELRETGISLVGKVPWGTYFCHFYETGVDLFDILLPYFQQGLINNERCLWVVFEPYTVADAIQALCIVLPTVDQHLASGALEIVHYTQWYDHDTTHDLVWLIATWQEKLAQALADGYAGLRVNGNEAWLTTQPWPEFLVYEETLRALIAKQRMLVLCTYPLAVTSASELFDLARLHEFAIIKRHGKWKLLQTPELTQAEAENKQLAATLDQLVSERTSELTATNAELRTEISERMRIEEQLRYYANLLANVSDAIISTDLAFNIKTWNSAAETIYGWHANEVMGKRIGEIVRTEYMEGDPASATRQLHQAGHWRGEVIHCVKDGTKRSILASVTLLHDQAGRPFGVVAVNRDITARKQLEAENQQLAAQFYQAQKMESIGRLAGGIAHDFNNLLMPIIGYAEIGMAKVPATDKLHADLRRIKEAGDRAASLTRQILAFSRQQLLEMKTIELNLVITKFEPLLQQLSGEDILLQIRLAAGLSPIKADEGQLEQVLLNLLVNARDAMPEGGTLTIETASVVLDATYVAQHTQAQPGPYVLLTVSDNGHGMDAITQQHIFEPFFTTKAPGRGTGMGLATVFGIVKQHHGSIWVYSEVGHGTTFKIYLPVAEPARVQVALTTTAPTSLAGTETILLAEDDANVRQLVGDILRAHGYHVLEAETPAQALLLANTYRDPIHLLLSDVIMPQMNGRKLYQQLTTVRAGLRVLFMSGYTSNIIASHDLSGETAAFLQKPFTIDNLLQKVRTVIDSGIPTGL